MNYHTVLELLEKRPKENNSQEDSENTSEAVEKTDTEQSATQ